MPERSTPSTKPWQSAGRLRILKEAELDPAYALLKVRDDLQLMLSFVERFDKLGWIPPVAEEQRQLLAAFGVSMHEAGANTCFFEYHVPDLTRTGRPRLTVFFHVDPPTRIVRVSGIERSEIVDRRRSMVVTSHRMRVEELVSWLRQHS